MPYSSPGPLCGSLPATDAHVIQAGDMVAAHVVKPDDDRWILAVTLKCDRDRYTVEDLIEDEDKKEFAIDITLLTHMTHPQTLRAAAA